jgi:hypothetical protein
MVALGLGLGLEQGLELLEVGLELDRADLRRSADVTAVSGIR